MSGYEVRDRRINMIYYHFTPGKKYYKAISVGTLKEPKDVEILSQSRTIDRNGTACIVGVRKTENGLRECIDLYAEKTGVCMTVPGVVLVDDYDKGVESEENWE